jgi:hypothetical protein
MKTNIKLINKALLTLLLVGSFASSAHASCTGGACMASFAKKPSAQIESSSFPTLAESQNRDKDGVKVDSGTRTFVVSNSSEYLNVEQNRVSYSDATESSPIFVQVGAFKNLKGAKIFSKRYKLIGDQFSTEIATVSKDNSTIYRVYVKGFENIDEANMFVDSYQDIGAFLVSL